MEDIANLKIALKPTLETHQNFFFEGVTMLGDTWVDRLNSAGQLLNLDIVIKLVISNLLASS